MSQKKKIGLVGFGVVGQGVYKLLRAQEDSDFEIKTIVVKDQKKERILPRERFSYSLNDVLSDDEIDIIVEVTNDEQAGFEVVQSALLKGVDVVSGSKKMLANHLSQLKEAALKGNAKLRYEAAVGGTIPILNTIDSYLKGEDVTGVRGILNGTSNYMLTSILHGESYATALREAQLKGFAESDPTMDVGGYDAKFKLSLLVHQATGAYLPPSEIVNVGIGSIAPKDVHWGEAFGYKLKPVATWSKVAGRDVYYSLPTFIPFGDSLTTVSGVLNGVELETKNSGEYRLTGEGAGEKPTAHAIWSDLNNIVLGQGYDLLKEGKSISVDTSAELPLYIRSTSPEVRALFSDIEVVEKTQSGVDLTWIANVSIQKLLSLSDVAKKQVFIAVLPSDHLNKYYEVNAQEAILI